MVVGIIPARGGSKGVVKKNIRKLAGYPLITYAIAASRLSGEVERTIVSTDSEEIAETAKHFGAEVPFLRPGEYARDDSPDIEFVRHAIGYFRDIERACPDYLVHLRPTTPLREPAVIDEAVRLIKGAPGATALRSVHEIPESPYKLFGIKDGYLVGLYPDDPRPEYYNLPRQSFPPVFKPNGYVDVIKPKTVLAMDSLHGPRMLSFVTRDTGEIDREEDFDFVEYRLNNPPSEIYSYLKKHYGTA